MLKNQDVQNTKFAICLYGREMQSFTLQKEQLNSSPIRVMELRSMRLLVHMACVGYMRNVYKILT